MTSNDSKQDEAAQAIAIAAENGEDFIKSRIFTIRGVQVMLDHDLATLYGVETKVLNQAVKRNIGRFPMRFMFQLSEQESANLKSQNVTSSWGGRRYSPYAFTEQGVAMLASVLKSETAVEVSIRIMDAFVAMRRALVAIAPVLTRLDTMERRQITDQQRNDERFDIIFKAMDGGDFPPQKVFFGGKHYDAYFFTRKLVRKATKSIVLVDNYCDDVTLVYPRHDALGGIGEIPPFFTTPGDADVRVKFVDLENPNESIKEIFKL